MGTAPTPNPPSLGQLNPLPTIGAHYQYPAVQSSSLLSRRSILDPLVGRAGDRPAALSRRCLPRPCSAAVTGTKKRSFAMIVAVTEGRAVERVLCSGPLEAGFPSTHGRPCATPPRGPARHERLGSAHHSRIEGPSDQQGASEFADQVPISFAGLPAGGRDNSGSASSASATSSRLGSV